MPRPKHTIQIQLLDPVFKLMTAAAKRRSDSRVSMSVDTLCAQIVGGVVTRLSIDRTLAAWEDFLTATRATGCAKQMRQRFEIDAAAHAERESAEV